MASRDASLSRNAWNRASRDAKSNKAARTAGASRIDPESGSTSRALIAAARYGSATRSHHATQSRSSVERRYARMQAGSSGRIVIASNAQVSNGSQPPMTFDLSLSESAAPVRCTALVRSPILVEACARIRDASRACPLPSLTGCARAFAMQGGVQGTYCRRKKPTPFVMKRYCEFVTSVGMNNPPSQFPHAPPMSGLN